MMEILIITCLLVIIVLLLKDKIVIIGTKKLLSEKEDNHIKLPDIMGEPNRSERLSAPRKDSGSLQKKEKPEADTFAVEINEEEAEEPMLQEEPDQDLGELSAWEEEKEWAAYGVSDMDDGFAQGVTFEELGTAGKLLQSETLEASQKELAGALVQKIYGTELFSLLESSLPDATRKIAALLDGSLHSPDDPGSSILQKKEWKDFDIGEFI